MRPSLALALVLTTAATLGAAADAQAFTFFQSPSKNIGCVMSKGTGVRCDIRFKDWQAPPKPRSCELDWGNGLNLGRRAHFNCAGDTTLGVGRLLAYGTSVRRGRYRCTSRRVGMRCVNRRTHHGFLLSRERARRF